MSSTLIVAAIFTLGLGAVHLRIPAIVRYATAIGADGPGARPLGAIGRGRAAYHLRRQDLIGIAWVMSNAASYVLISIGVVDLRLALGPPDAGLGPLSGWIAGWWAVRAIGQHALGRRPIDLVLAAWFWALAIVHLGWFVAVAR